MKQKTYDLFISQVEKNNYEVIDNIGDYYDKINIKCKSCNKIYLRSPFSILKYPNCKCKREFIAISKDDFIKKMKNSGFNLVMNEDGLNFNKNDFQLKCNICESIKKYKHIKNALNARCKMCLGGKYKETIKEAILIAKERNLEMMDEKYKGVLSYYNFKCKSGHLFNRQLSEIKKLPVDSHPCRECHIEKRKMQNPEEKFMKNGFKLISPYVNILTKVEVECLNCGARHSSVANSILNAGVKCVYCSGYYLNEMFTGTILKKLFGNAVVKNFFVNEKIYNNGEMIKKYIIVDYKLLFNGKIYFIEYNGEQHYRPVKFGNMSDEDSEKTYKNTKIRDEWVEKYCFNNNISLLSIDGRHISGYKSLETEIHNHFRPILES